MSQVRTFAGLRIQDREGKKLATVAVEVSRRGVRLEGKKGTLGNFPYQSIGSWTRASTRSLGLVVAANDAQREVILHADDPKVVEAVLTAIDAMVQSILHEMSNSPGGTDAMQTTNVEATYATPNASSGSEGEGELGGDGTTRASSSPAEVSSKDGPQMTRTESVAKMRAAAADKKRREAENRAVLAERDLAATVKELAELRATLATSGAEGADTAVNNSPDATGLASDLKVAQLEEELRNVRAQLDSAIERRDAVAERELRVSNRERAVAEAELEDVEAEEALKTQLTEASNGRRDAERALEASAREVERLQSELDEMPRIIPATPVQSNDAGRLAELERERDEWRARSENLSEELDKAKAAAEAAAHVSEALAAKAATPAKPAKSEKAAASSAPFSPEDESLRAEALRRAADSERECTAAREETREARRASKEAAWRADVAEEKAKVAEGRAAAAEARARQSAAAAESAGSLNLEAAGVEAKTELVDVKIKLRAAEAELSEAKKAVDGAREEADSARAAAAQLSASAATNAAAAAAYYSMQQGGGGMDHREADTKAKDASSEVYSRMATDADRIGTPGSSGNSPHTSATAAATAVAMQSHAEAEGLRIELEQARSDLRRHEERARAVAGDLDAAWTSAGEAHMGSRHLATELDRAKAESDLLAHELQGNKSYELIASERARFEARLAAANDVSRRLGEEKGDLEAALKAESRERARVEHARETLEKHLTDADTQIASLREELARTLGHLTAARDEAAAASLARTELEIEMRSMRHDADEVTRRLDEHADANASELEAAARDRTRLAEALREVTAERDAALRRSAEYEARVAAKEGERDGVAVRAAGVAAEAEAVSEAAKRDVERMRHRVDAAEANAQVTSAENRGLKAELDAARASRDAAAAELREERARREQLELGYDGASVDRQSVDALTREAEAALARASRSEKEAAEEVARLRREAESLTERMKAANVDAASRARHDRLSGLVLELDATEKEVAKKAERNAKTIAALDASVDALARRLVEKPAQLFAYDGGSEGGPERSLARDAERLNREESVGVARIMGMKPLTLSDRSNKFTPWFPEVASSVAGKPTVSALRPAEAGGEPTRGGAKSSAASAVAEYARDAREAAEKARSRKAERERESAKHRYDFFYGGSYSAEAATVFKAEKPKKTTERPPRSPGPASARSQPGGTSAKGPKGGVKIAIKRSGRAAEDESAGDESRWKDRLGRIEAENAAVRLRLRSMVADSESIVRKEFGEESDVPRARAVRPPAPSQP